MNDLQFLVSITISEFEMLRDLGSFRVDPSRIIVTRGGADAGYGAEVDAQLLAKLPEFRPSEDHAVLILAFSGWIAGHQPVAEPLSPLLSGRVTLSVRQCTQVIPLTSRARSILAGRLEGQVVLEEAVFEDLVEGHLKRLEQLASLVGAEALLEALIEKPKTFHSERLRLALQDSDHAHASLLVKMLGFTRHKPFPKEPVSGLADLGGLLKPSTPKTAGDTLKEFGAWVRRHLEPTRGFRKVYADQELARILARVTRAWDLPASAASLAIFLYWRDLALRAGGIDLNALETDCRELAGLLDAQVVADALWLLGFSSGFEAIALGCYRRMGKKNPFNPTASTTSKVSLLNLATAVNLEPAGDKPDNAAYAEADPAASKEVEPTLENSAVTADNNTPPPTPSAEAGQDNPAEPGNSKAARNATPESQRKPDEQDDVKLSDVKEPTKQVEGTAEKKQQQSSKSDSEFSNKKPSAAKSIKPEPQKDPADEAETGSKEAPPQSAEKKRKTSKKPTSPRKAPKKRSAGKATKKKPKNADEAALFPDDDSF